MRACSQKGKVVFNGVKPEAHEMDAFLFLASLGKSLELIVPSNTPHSRRPDFFMDGIAWELKSPKVATRRTLERTFYDASKQSDSIMMDLRRIKNEDSSVMILEKCFLATRKIKRMYILTKSQKLRYYKK